METIVLDKKDISPFNDGKFQGWGTSFVGGQIELDTMIN